MPSVTVAWYDRRNKKAGYHICRNCKDGKDIDNRDLIVGKEYEIRRAGMEICCRCKRLQRRTAFGVCGKITIQTS